MTKTIPKISFGRYTSRLLLCCVCIAAASHASFQHRRTRRPLASLTRRATDPSSSPASIARLRDRIPHAGPSFAIVGVVLSSSSRSPPRRPRPSSPPDSSSLQAARTMRGGGGGDGGGAVDGGSAVPSSLAAKASSTSDYLAAVGEFSNWRTMPRNRRAPMDDGDNNDERDSVARSPFSHLLSPSSPGSEPTSTSTSPVVSTAAAAPWSSEAYENAVELHRRFEECDDPYLAPLLKTALHDLGLAYRLYGPHCVVGSYNGGKDAVVILHLLRAVHAAHCRDALVGEKEETGDKSGGFVAPRPRVIYFQHKDEFPEVLALLEETVKAYDLDMLAFEEGISFGEGLTTLVENNLSPGLDGFSHYGLRSEAGMGPVLPLPPPHPLAFVLGTRKDDPNAGSQGTYAPSSHYMPPFMRINPVLDWSYGQVWHFLRSFDLPYCSLYDEGYTSLGTTQDTLPCPALKKPNGGGYLPAYMLREWDQERAGRVKKPKTKAKDGESGNNGGASTSLDAKTSSDEGSTKAKDGDARRRTGVLRTMSISQTSSTASLPAMDREARADDVENSVDDAASDPSDDQPLFRRRQTVGLIVIGDELLKGQTPDVNILAAARAFRGRNVSLSRVSVVSDDRATISDEIRRVSEEVDVVVTSGGMGPTHDDVTVKSVADALGCGMEPHGEMAKLLLEKMGEQHELHRKTTDEVWGDKEGEAADEGGKIEKSTHKSAVNRRAGDEKVGGPGENCSEKGGEAQQVFSFLSEGQRKMATLPSASRLRYLSENDEDWPVLQCKNVFVLPGVPTCFERKVQQLAVYLSANGMEGGVTYRIVLSVDENSIVEALNAAVMAHPHVTFGSYPLADHPEFKTVVTLEGRFYNGGYNISSGRFLGLTPAPGANNSSGGDHADGTVSSSSLMFSKEEMKLNVKMALEDLMAGLPAKNILRVDSNDDLIFS